MKGSRKENVKKKKSLKPINYFYIILTLRYKNKIIWKYIRF